MPEKRSYKELVIRQETHQEYTITHLKNIDSHLDALNNKVAKTDKANTYNEACIQALDKALATFQKNTWRILWALFSLITIMLGALITLQIVV